MSSMDYMMHSIYVCGEYVNAVIVDKKYYKDLEHLALMMVKKVPAKFSYGTAVEFPYLGILIFGDMIDRILLEKDFEKLPPIKLEDFYCTDLSIDLKAVEIFLKKFYFELLDKIREDLEIFAYEVKWLGDKLHVRITISPKETSYDAPAIKYSEEVIISNFYYVIYEEKIAVKVTYVCDMHNLYVVSNLSELGRVLLDIFNRKRFVDQEPSIRDIYRRAKIRALHLYDEA